MCIKKEKAIINFYDSSIRLRYSSFNSGYNRKNISTLKPFFDHLITLGIRSLLSSGTWFGLLGYKYNFNSPFEFSLFNSS